MTDNLDGQSSAESALLRVSAVSAYIPSQALFAPYESAKFTAYSFVFDGLYFFIFNMSSAEQFKKLHSFERVANVG